MDEQLSRPSPVFLLMSPIIFQGIPISAWSSFDRGKSTIDWRASTSANVTVEREASELPRTQEMQTRSQGDLAIHPVRPSSPHPSVDLVGNPTSFSQQPSA
ncbi:hypothetical protein HAX54_035060 [Datura stramonium]|uniref:Uncharacterized protein n=1 Tax=Datura stramonium TaxID=4076 RepID=A0ABS8VIG9_DATST|nr:hypothetical protein [Datura stramonium]